MRLFQITDLTTRKAVPNLFFSDKKLAKEKRRELNGPLETSIPPKLRYVVSPGPDHKNYRP